MERILVAKGALTSNYRSFATYNKFFLIVHGTPLEDNNTKPFTLFDSQLRTQDTPPPIEFPPSIKLSIFKCSKTLSMTLNDDLME